MIAPTVRVAPAMFIMTAYSGGYRVGARGPKTSSEMSECL